MSLMHARCIHAGWIRLAAISAVVFASVARAQAPTPLAGENVNIVAGTSWPDGDPFLQRQNEPSLAVSSVNPSHLFAATNDYRTVDLPNPTGTTGRRVGDSWHGIYRSLDGGLTWKTTLLPGYPQQEIMPALYQNSQTADAVLWRQRYATGSMFSAYDPGSVLRQPIANTTYYYNAAADPVVRAGPDGMFYLLGMAFSRETSQSVIFVARFLDVNDGSTDPIKYLGTSIVADGSSQVVDKPWLAVDVPRAAAGTAGTKCTYPAPWLGSGKTVTVSAGTLYATFTNFPSTSGNNQIRFVSSTDCGTTWAGTGSSPSLLSSSNTSNQDSTIAIDPKDGTVYVAWRRFLTSNAKDDAIVLARSTDFGKHFDQNDVAKMLAFDQNDDSKTFRGNSYPAMAVSSTGTSSWVHVAWPQRDATTGDSRIVLATAQSPAMSVSGALAFSTPSAVDAALRDESGVTSSRGHQFMPALTFTQGRLVLVYYDTRLDHTVRYLKTTPNAGENSWFLGQAYSTDGVTLNPDYLPWWKTDPIYVIPLGFMTDAVPDMKVLRTTDVRVATALAGPSPSFNASRISNFPVGFIGDESTLNNGLRPLYPNAVSSAPAVCDAQTNCPTSPQVQTVSGGAPSYLHQLRANVPNYPMFKGGTIPFMGDYIDVAGPSLVRDASGNWQFNIADTPTPVHYAVWTSNHDVKPPPLVTDPVTGNLVYDWPGYKPIPLVVNGVNISNLFATGSASGTFPTASYCGSGTTDTAYTGTRNQNVYTSRITEGLVVTSPQNVKLLDSDRIFTIDVQNGTGSPMQVDLCTGMTQAGVCDAYGTTTVPRITFDSATGPITKTTRPIAPGETYSVSLFVSAAPNQEQTIYVTATKHVDTTASSPAPSTLVLNPPGSDFTVWMSATNNDRAFSAYFVDPQLGQWSQQQWSQYQWSQFQWSQYQWSQFQWSQYQWSQYQWSQFQWSQFQWSQYQWSQYQSSVGDVTYVMANPGSGGTYTVGTTGTPDPGTFLDVTLFKTGQSAVPGANGCTLQGLAQQAYASHAVLQIGYSGGLLPTIDVGNGESLVGRAVFFTFDSYPTGTSTSPTCPTGTVLLNAVLLDGSTRLVCLIPQTPSQTKDTSTSVVLSATAPDGTQTPAPPLIQGASPTITYGYTGTLFTPSLVANTGVPDFTWSIVDDPTSALSVVQDATTKVWTVSLNKVLNVGSYTFTLGVKDSKGATNTKKITFTVTALALGSTSVTITANDKPYDGTTAATISACSLSGILASDANLVQCVATNAVFASAAVGSWTVTANISLTGTNASNYTLSSTTATTTARITPAGTITTLTSSLNPSIFGQPVTFTASVTSTATGTLGGSVTFMDGAIALGSATVSSSGTAQLTVSTLGAGTHPISAVYGGATNYAGSTSGVLSQVVNQAGTGTTLTSSANPSMLTQNVTFTATVKAVAPGAGTPTGTVTFSDNGTSLGSATLSSGVARLTTSTLTLGTHPITATYAGTANFLTSTSATVSQVVNPLVYTFTGFFSPLNGSSTTGTTDSGTYNWGKALPIKWSVQDPNGTYLTDISLATGPNSSLFAYNTSDCGGQTSGYANTIWPGLKGGSSFKAGNNQFTLSWDTSTVPKGCQYKIVLTLKDGTTHSTLITLR